MFNWLFFGSLDYNLLDICRRTLVASSIEFRKSSIEIVFVLLFPDGRIGKARKTKPEYWH